MITIPARRVNGYCSSQNPVFTWFVVVGFFKEKMNIINKITVIDVKYPVRKGSDFCPFFNKGTSSNMIKRQIEQANESPDVLAISIIILSPGGYSDSLHMFDKS